MYARPDLQQGEEIICDLFVNVMVGKKVSEARGRIGSRDINGHDAKYCTGGMLCDWQTTSSRITAPSRITAGAQLGFTCDMGCKPGGRDSATVPTI